MKPKPYKCRRCDGAAFRLLRRKCGKVERRCRSCSGAGSAAYRKRTRKVDPKAFYVKYGRNDYLKKEYGITATQYDAMVAAQDGRCAVCASLPLASRRLAVDHDHETGKVRGLLCSNCNTALGLLRDRQDVIEALAKYHRRHDRGR